MITAQEAAALAEANTPEMDLEPIYARIRSIASVGVRSILLDPATKLPPKARSELCEKGFTIMTNANGDTVIRW